MLSINARLYMLIQLCTCFCLSYSHDKITGVFDSLTKIEQYASHINEYPKPDNVDWENPDFTTYQEEISPNYVYTLLTVLGLVHPLWSPLYLKQLLTILTNMHEYEGYQGRFVRKINPIPGSHFIIFGELQGAFHSLVRDLRTLKELGFIDEHFKIIKPDTYLIFNGNIASRSANALEMLTLVARILYVNPDYALCTRGGQEDKERWKNYALKRELMTRILMNFIGSTPMSNIIDRFFNTLPLAVYLVTYKNPQQVELVRISNYGTESKEFSEKEFADFFTTPYTSVTLLDTPRKHQSANIALRAIIRGQQYYQSQYIPSQGLQLSGKEEGATGWTIYSSPTESYQTLFQFYYDAFVILTTHPLLDDWTLTLYNKDVRDQEKIAPKKIFKLVAGFELDTKKIAQLEMDALNERLNFFEQRLSAIDNQIKTIKLTQLKQELGELEVPPTQPISKKPEKKDIVIAPSVSAVPSAPTASLDIPLGAHKSVITLGSTVDLSNGLKEEGTSIDYSIRQMVDMCNQSNCTPGVSLKTVILDDMYTPARARANVTNLLNEHKTGLLVMPLGTATLESYLDLVKTNSIAVLFPSTGASIFRQPDISSIVNLRDSYFNEGYVVTKYMIEQQKSNTFILFYQNDMFGIDALKGAHKALQEHNIKNFIEISHERNDLNFGDAIKKIKDSHMSSLGFFTIQSAARELIVQLGSTWFIGKKLFGIQTVSTRAFYKFLARNNLHCITTCAVPNPSTSQLEIVKEYRKLFEGKHDLVPEVYGLEAFIATDLLTYLIRQCKIPITAKQIIASAENIHHLNYKGLSLNFDSQTRQLMHTIWLDTGSDEWTMFDLTPTVPVPQPVQKKLMVGSTMDLSRGNMEQGKNVLDGTELALEKAAQQELLIKFVPLDDGYVPEKARENVEKLIKEHGVNLLLNPVSSETFAGYIDLIKTGSIDAIFPIPGNPFHRTPENSMKNCIYFRPSYEDETYVLINYLMGTYKPTSIAAFYQDDGFGHACLEGIKKALKGKNIELKTVSYARNDLDFSSQVQQIAQSGASYIVLCAVPRAATKFLESVGSNFLTKNKFIAVSDLGTINFKKWIDEKKITLVLSHVVPDFQTKSLPIVQEFVESVRKKEIPLDTRTFEAYINAQIFIHVLKNLEGPLENRAIFAAIEGLKNVNFKGLKLNFDPYSRQLSKSIWIEDGAGPWQEKFVPQSLE
jgi:ABC-type branched-subunit amino acid transport system substrate-binding protein